MDISMDINVKHEFGDPSTIKDRILALCQEKPEGISQDEIMTVCPGIDKADIAGALNELLNKSLLTVLKLRNGGCAFKLTGEESGELEGFSEIEKVVYKKIKESGNQGIWINTLRDYCKVPTVQMNKVIKVLEGKRKIKPVKSVTEKKKKIYMLYDLTPAEVISGGNYYQNQEFDDKFAEVIMTVSHKFLNDRRADAEKESPNSPYAVKQMSYAASADVLDYIKRCKISRVDMTVKDIEEALWGLYYEGKVEFKEMASKEEGHQKQWRAISPLVHPSTGTHQTPCGTCPVMSQCHVGGAISPQDCPYLKGWLSF